MVLGLEYENGSLITTMALHFPSIQLEAGRVISVETCRLADVFSPDDLGSGPYTQLLLYTYHIL